MGHRGSGRYARGDNAVAICERCSEKRLRRHLVYDGQFPDLLVCTDCWDPKHPQEYLPPAFDPVTIYDPTGDPDKLQANAITMSYPVRQNGVERQVLPLQLGVTINDSRFKYDVAGGVGAIVES